ncbi:hypothetical protein HC024_14105 [Methylococcaceae bacterium WWC4]|nr:hypothetical protein [Methylococcaceae bacterium WWC4]
MKTMQILVKVKNGETSFLNDENSLELIPEGCSIFFEPKTKSLGMSTSEVIINVVINFSSGVPAGLLANWLFNRLQLSKTNRAFDNNGELVSSIKELEEKIDTLKKSK